MLNKLQYLSFEIAPYCNLAGEHDWCPVNDPMRYPKHEDRVMCSFNAIIDFLRTCIGRGFQGYVGFHYYTDPLINLKRMIDLMGKIKEALPDIKFILWTNGILLEEASKQWLKSFDKVMITVYDEKNKEKFTNLMKDIQNGGIQIGEHDDRRLLYSCKETNAGGCSRPELIELPVNFYGNVRLCCSDYRGEISLGNIERENHESILDGFEEAALCASKGLIPLCWRCRALKSSPAVPI